MRRTGTGCNFNQHIAGIYGESSTVESHRIEYLLTTMPIEKAVRELSTALDVLDFNKIEFSQLVQRDIDIGRVRKGIINGYLKSGKDKVVFFPPLIACLVGVDNGVPVDAYPSANISVSANYRDWGKAALKRWGNLFQLSFYPQEGESAWSKNVKNADGLEETIYFENYNVALDFDSSKSKLIVIDGQHRLKALEYMWSNEEDRRLIANMNIPVCIFMPSEAPGDRVDDDVIRDMRELFVTINTEAQKVSGHFRDLLNDRRISCISVRNLASIWKKQSSVNDGKSPLHLLEWNQRSDRNVFQRMTPYSVTTVSIISNALDAILSSRCHAMLNLTEVEDELTNQGGEGFEYIRNDNFSLGEAKVIEGQINKYLVPALDCIFRKSIPYAKVESIMSKALVDLNNRSAETGVISFRKRLFEFREGIDGVDQEESIDAERGFMESVKKSLDQSDSYYLTNAFQSALLFAWGDLFDVLRSLVADIDPVHVATTMVEALNEFLFISPNLLQPEREFTQDLLFDGLKIKYQEYAKCACKNFILLSLCHDESFKTIEKNIKVDKAGLTATFDGLYQECLDKYRDELLKQRVSSMVRSWTVADIPEPVKEKLTKAKSSRERQQICSEHLQNKVDKHIEILSNLVSS